MSNLPNKRNALRRKLLGCVISYATRKQNNNRWIHCWKFGVCFLSLENLVSSSNIGLSVYDFESSRSTNFLTQWERLLKIHRVSPGLCNFQRGPLQVFFKINNEFAIEVYHSAFTTIFYFANKERLRQLG